MKNKFPRVYCCSLNESFERRDNLKKQFLKYNVNSFYILLSDKFENSNDKVRGQYLNYLDDGTIGATVSHLKMIQKWYNETNEPYGFFCEDDLSFETIQYWNFTWNEFIDNLPKNWDCIQLLCCGPHLDNIKFRKRYWDDFSVGSYIISRNYAKVLIDSFIDNDEFVFEFPEKDFWAPIPENLIYFSPKTVVDGKNNILKYNVYTFPLFVEEINFDTTFLGRNSKNMGINDGIYDYTHKQHHVESYYNVIEWWKTIGKNLTIQEIINV